MKERKKGRKKERKKERKERKKETGSKQDKVVISVTRLGDF